MMFEFILNNVFQGDYGFYGTYPTSAETVESFVNGSLADRIMTSLSGVSSRRKRSVEYYDDDDDGGYDLYQHFAGRKFV